MSRDFPEFKEARNPISSSGLNPLDGVNDPWRFLPADAYAPRYNKNLWISPAMKVSWSAGAVLSDWANLPDDRLLSLGEDPDGAGNRSSEVRMYMVNEPAPTQDPIRPSTIIYNAIYYQPFGDQSIAAAAWSTIGGVRVLTTNNVGAPFDGGGEKIVFFTVHPHVDPTWEASLEEPVTPPGIENNPFPDLDFQDLLGPDVTIVEPHPWAPGDPGENGDYWLNTETNFLYWVWDGSWNYAGHADPQPPLYIPGGPRRPRDEPKILPLDGPNDPWQFLPEWGVWLSPPVIVTWDVGSIIPAWNDIPDDRPDQIDTEGNYSPRIELTIADMPSLPDTLSPVQVLDGETLAFDTSTLPQGVWETVGGVRVQQPTNPVDTIATASGTGIAMFWVWPDDDGNVPFPELDIAAILGTDVVVIGAYNWLPGDGADEEWWVDTRNEHVYYRTDGLWEFRFVRQGPITSTKTAPLSGNRDPYDDPNLDVLDGKNDPWQWMRYEGQWGWVSQAVTISWAAGATIPKWMDPPDDRPNEVTSEGSNSSSYIQMNIGLYPPYPERKTPFDIIDEWSPFRAEGQDPPYGTAPRGGWEGVGTWIEPPPAGAPTKPDWDGVSPHRVDSRWSPAATADAPGVGIAFFVVYPWNAQGFAEPGTDVDNPFPDLDIETVLGTDVAVTGIYPWYPGDGVDGDWWWNTETNDLFFRELGTWTFDSVFVPAPYVEDLHTIKWGKAGNKYFETGVDRGVLFVNGVASSWDGLISVNESSSGGEADPYYLDGVKIFNVAKPEEFEASISAYASPPLFDQCDGTNQLVGGLFATMQRRVPFALCYRTKVGNDIHGLNHGYKLHIIYNALAAPTGHDYSTINDSVDPIELSWSLTTTPVYIEGRRPTSHIIIDSRTTSIQLMRLLENLLYGTVEALPELLTPLRITNLYNELGQFLITLLSNGRYSVDGYSVEVLPDGDFALTNDTVNIISDGLFEAGVED